MVLVMPKMFMELFSIFVPITTTNIDQTVHLKKCSTDRVLSPPSTTSKHRLPGILPTSVHWDSILHLLLPRSKYIHIPSFKFQDTAFIVFFKIMNFIRPLNLLKDSVSFFQMFWKMVPCHNRSELERIYMTRYWYNISCLFQHLNENLIIIRNL